MRLEMAGQTICPDACPGAPKEFTKFDGSYMVPFLEDVQERRP